MNNTTPAQQPQQNQSASIATMKKQLCDGVMQKVALMKEAGDLVIPQNYAVGNQLNLAWLRIMEMTTRDGRPVLEVATPASVANALLDMSLQGLSVQKKQCDFILYGNKLQCSREYHGNIALAKRLGGVDQVSANCIYEGDDFEYEINPETGRKHIVKHKQDFINVDPNKTKGVYAILKLRDGSTYVELMSMQQVRQAWMQGATKGQSPAHKNFPDQMAMKTVISRACKLFISTSDDAGMFGDDTEAQPQQTTFSATASDPIMPPVEEATFVDVTEHHTTAIEAPAYVDTQTGEILEKQEPAPVMMQESNECPI